MNCRWLVVVAWLVLATPHFLAVPAESSPWRQVPLPFSNANLGRFALAPSSPSTIYVIGNNTVLRSDQRGETWSQTALELPAGRVARSIVVSREDPDRVLVSAGGAIYETINGGFTWAQLSDPIAGSIQQLFIHPVDANLVFAVPGGDVPGLYRSSNGGKSWDIASPDLEDVSVRYVTVHESTPTLLVATVEDGIMRSTDGGNRWRQRESGLDLAEIKWSADPGRVYAVGRSGLYRSDDAGETFTAKASPQTGYNSWYYDGFLATHPTDPDALILTGCSFGYASIGYTGVALSETGGEDFVQLHQRSQEVGGKTRGLAIDPEEPDNVYYSTSHGKNSGFRHFQGPRLTGFRTLGPVFHQYGVRQVSSDGEGRTYAVVGSRVVRSGPGGQNWLMAPEPTTGGAGLWQGDPFVSLWVNEAGSVFYSVSGYTRSAGQSDRSLSGYIYYVNRSLDFGSRWETLWLSACINGYPTNCEGGQIVTNHSNGLIAYWLGQSSSSYTNNLYRVDARSYPDTLVHVDHGAAKLSIHPDDPFRLYSTFGERRLSESTDGGFTWAPVDEGLPEDGEAVRTFQRRDRPEIMQLVYTDGSIYRSTDAAISWTLANTMKVDASFIREVTWDPTSGHVFALTDDGRIVSTWPLDVSDFPGAPTSIHYATDRQTLLVATSANGLFERSVRIRTPPELAVFDSKPQKADRGANVPLLHLSPNPTAGSLKIRVEGTTANGLDVEVFDARGRLVRQLSKRSEPATLNPILWDGRSDTGKVVPSGVYFVRFRGDELNEVRKVTLVR